MEDIINDEDSYLIDDDEVITGRPTNIDDFEINDLEYIPSSKKNSLPSKRHLNFHLIINTNKRKDQMESIEFDVLWDRLAKACPIFFEKYFPRLFSLFEVKTPGAMADIPLKDRIIEKPKIDFIREIGPTRSLIHLHAVIKFTVRALTIRLNKIGIEKVFSKLLGLVGVHVYVKLHRDAAGNLDDYIRKTLIDNY